MQKKKAFFFSYPSALYLRRSQNYEKSRAKQKNLFFFLPRRSNFAIFNGKVTNKRGKKTRRSQNYEKQSYLAFLLIFFHEKKE